MMKTTVDLFGSKLMKVDKDNQPTAGNAHQGPRKRKKELFTDESG